MFNIPQVAKVIWRLGYILGSHLTEERGSNSGTSGYKASGLSSTPWHLLQRKLNIKMIFSYLPGKVYFVATQKNHLNEMVLLSSHNICYK